MKVASKAVDDKILEANKYADAKRQEITHVTCYYLKFKLILILMANVFTESH